METTKDLLNAVNGWKTYILVGAGAALWLGTILGWWTFHQINELLGLLATLGVGTLGHKIDKLRK